MKKIILCLTALLLAAGAASAQRGLQTNPVFRGRVIPREKMVVTEVRGGDITNYRLDYYKCLRFQVDEALAREVAALVEADAVAGVSAETETVEGLLTYALIQPKPFWKRNRYLCYQARRAYDGSWGVTMLYLEGKATLEELRSMFDTQNEDER